MGKEKKVLLFALLIALCGTNTYANENTQKPKVKNSQSKAQNFDENTAKLSTGIHGYTVDFAAINSRTLSNTMLNRALTRDYIKARPVNSWTQDIIYMDNSHELGGLMNVDYDENGILGVSERQILPNGRIGLVYGGTNGKAKFNDGESGDVNFDGAYAGGYYHHDFNDTWALNSRALFAYTHNRVDRMYNGELIESNYPIYSFGLGTSLIYTLVDSNYNKAYFYGGIDINKLHQGNINENEDKVKGQAQGSIKNVATTYPFEKTYWSIAPSAGFLAENTGYILDKKYRIGASVGWETELGNIKDGKRISNLVISQKGGEVAKEYKIDTEDRENVFSYSVFGAIDITENLAVNAKYTSMFSDGYDADMIGAGFEYKIDTMARNQIIGPVIYGMENHRPSSDRWKGTLTVLMETEDDTDIPDYTSNFLTGGDNATSTKYRPKFMLSLNDTKSKWQYYFEGYYMNNSMFQGRKGNELQDQYGTRIHGEAKWVDSYSKGRYGFTIGYRNETSEKGVNLAYGVDKRPNKWHPSRIQERGIHQLRLAPNATYNLGHGFMLTGRVNGIFQYNYKGDKEGQLDFLTETDIGIQYTGFMPKWKIIATYHRDDTWYDEDLRPIQWNGTQFEEIEYDPAKISKRWHLAQFRPSITYYFGNNSSFKFDARIPLGNGAWTNYRDGKKSAKEDYEVRYGFTYSQQVSSGLTVNLGATFVPTKYKNGSITQRKHSFRPNIGFSYSF